MASGNPSSWKDDVRFWLRQQQLWNDIRTIQRDGWHDYWKRCTIWPKILKTAPLRTAPIKPGGAVECHVMCHNGDWLLAVWMLKSLLIHFPEKPQVIIHIENALRPSSLAKLTHHFPDARIIQPEEGRVAVAKMLLEQNLTHCLHWWHTSRIMYKMFSVQAQAGDGNLIGLDPDILFFKAPPELLAVQGSPVNGFTFQRDQLHGYTLTCDEAKSALDISLEPNINSGIILRTKAALDLRLVENLLTSPVVAKPSGHLEQTLYALCASKAKAVRFLPKEYALSMGDRFDCETLICRHYAGASKRFIADEGMQWLIQHGLFDQLK